MSEDIWSKQFYKALEAVGNLTEQERLKLGNMLISLSGVKEKPSNTGSISRGYTARGIQVTPSPRPTGQGYQPVKSETLGEIKSPPKKP